jgi:UDP-glucose 4-epimerase
LAHTGSHVVLCCLLTNKYKVATIDNFHNSFPEAIKRVSQIARSELPSSASDEDKAATEVDLHKGDITKQADIDAVFQKYKEQGNPVWGVIHVAALKAVGESGEIPIAYYQTNICATINLLDVRAVRCVASVVYKWVQGHETLRLPPPRLLVLGHRLWRAQDHPHPRNDAPCARVVLRPDQGHVGDDH